jgi:hypothetical protein
MMESRSKTHLSAVSSILAVVLLLSAIPFSTNVVVVPGQRSPEFTINLCQPAQLFGQPANNIIARPSVKAPLFILLLRGPFMPAPLTQAEEPHVAPATPPPKPLV